jgi:hypothetical protein
MTEESGRSSDDPLPSLSTRAEGAAGAGTRGASSPAFETGASDIGVMAESGSSVASKATLTPITIVAAIAAGTCQRRSDECLGDRGRERTARSAAAQMASSNSPDGSSRAAAR